MYLAERESNPTKRALVSPHDNISPFNPIFEATGQPTFPNTITNISRFPFTAITSLAFTGGGIVSNVKDVADWCSALFTGRATSRSVLNTMLRSISTTPDEDGDFHGYGIWASTRISATDTFIGHDGNAPGYRSVMFYQPEKKLSLVILTNFHGADIYAVARALYEAIPGFTCDNKKEGDVVVCLGGKSLCVPRKQAAYLICNKGAYLGGCNADCEKAQFTFLSDQSSTKAEISLLVQNSLQAFPNPFVNKISFSFRVNQSGPVNLRLYDMNGKLLFTIFNGVVQKGIAKRVDFAAEHLPAGVYISRLQTVSGSTEQKLVRSR